MKIRKSDILFAILLALFAGTVYQTVELHDLKQDVDALSEGVSQVAAERERLMQQQAADIPEYIAIETAAAIPQPGFVPLDIPLDVSLQEHAWNTCQREEIPFNVFVALMWHESRYVPDIADHVNTNGTRDRGLCQINQVNWRWLTDERGLDIDNPYDNIEAGAIILGRFWRKYTPEQALTAYAWGEQGMLDADCIAPAAYRILEVAGSYNTQEE